MLQKKRKEPPIGTVVDQPPLGVIVYLGSSIWLRHDGTFVNLIVNTMLIADRIRKKLVKELK